MTAQNPALKSELAAQQAAADAVNSLGLREFQDDESEQYWSGVYNRIERRGGWLLVIAGTVLVCGYSLYELLTEPDVHTVFRIGMAALIVGFGLVFSGVLRQRMRTAGRDKYKGVMR